MKSADKTDKSDTCDAREHGENRSGKSNASGARKSLDIGSKGMGQTGKKICRCVVLAPLDKADGIA